MELQTVTNLVGQVRTLNVGEPVGAPQRLDNTVSRRVAVFIHPVPQRLKPQRVEGKCFRLHVDDGDPLRVVGRKSGRSGQSACQVMGCVEDDSPGLSLVQELDN